MTGAFALGMAALIVLFVAGIFWLARLIADAPDCYENATGFHFGPMPPFIADERDGVDFKTIHDGLCDDPDGHRFTAPASPFHSSTDSREGQ